MRGRADGIAGAHTKVVAGHPRADAVPPRQATLAEKYSAI